MCSRVRLVGIKHLETISRELANNAATLSQFLVHLLVDKDTKKRRMENWAEQLTDMLIVYAKENGMIDKQLYTNYMIIMYYYNVIIGIVLYN